MAPTGAASPRDLPGTITVLHVDDDRSVAELTATYLERADDRIQVRVETDPAEALETVSHTDIDCLVSDYQMPGMDGVELLEAVREECPDLPFILYTNRGSEEVASEAIGAGATDYFQKGGGRERYELLANRIVNAVERYRSKRHAAELERVRTLLRRIDRSLVRASSESEIESEVCSILADADPYVFAWIGHVDPAEDRIEPSASAGIDNAYLDDITITVDRSETGLGPGGRAVRNRSVEVSQDVRDDPTFEPWQEAVAEKGVRSVAAVPIEHEDDLFGVLVVEAERVHAFDDDERRLLADLGNDIAHAIDRLRARAEIERERNRHAALFENSPDPIVAVDFDDGTARIDDVNAAFERVFGYPASDVVGRSVADAIVPASEQSRHESLRDQVFEGERTEAVVTRTTTRGEREFRLRVIPLDVTDVSSGAYAWYTDVTEQHRYEERLETVNRASRELMNTTNERAVAETTVAAAQAILEDSLAAVWSYDATAEELVPLAATDGRESGSFDEPAAIPEGTPEMAAFRDDEMRLVESYQSADRPAYPDLSLGAVLIVPLGEHGQLMVGTGEHDTFDDATRDLFAMLCRTAELALDRVDRERTLSELNDVSRKLVIAESVDDVAATAATAGSEILDLPFTHIYLTDEDGETLRPAAATERTTERFGELPTFPKGVGLFWHVLESGETHVYDDVQESETLASDLPFRAAIVAPLGKAGVLASGSLSPGEFDSTDRKHTEILAATTESALERAERESRLRERERELEAARNRFRSVFEHSNDAVVIFDPEADEILEANPQATELLEYSHEELLDKGPSDIHPGEMDRFREFVDTVIDRGRGRTERLSCVTKTGESVPAEISASTLEFDGRDSVLALIRDVSELRSYERELERQNERLEQFASVVSHDLRNPLNVASGRVELARKETGNEHLPPAKSSLDRMEQLIDDTLALARAGDPELTTESVALDTLVRDSWGNVDTRDAELTVSTALTVLGDRSRLRRVFENLFRNAIDHGGDDVAVTVGDLPDEAGFYVADDGPGIPADQRSAVFEQGYSTGESGTGFGLSIVREIVDAHGWEITVTESEAGGARFEITGVDIEV
jgi:PAS domain S-box-containing protein